eukprot:CAMPEP_0171864212 /NCGR_PEP_ID=MMETSP0992-20121227/28721_1 /TAXON_ID=483369 /ORGANISM="non described non described, Strain CCMP2098" /LENGTH=78 /DNA_ID=CAMNT_0012486737 /DNA_START=252 /DNA_END=488 /DNA_ORIENTATION=-
MRSAAGCWIWHRSNWDMARSSRQLLSESLIHAHGAQVCSNDAAGCWTWLGPRINPTDISNDHVGTFEAKVMRKPTELR